MELTKGQQKHYDTQFEEVQISVSGEHEHFPIFFFISILNIFDFHYLLNVFFSREKHFTM